MVDVGAARLVVGISPTLTRVVPLLEVVVMPVEQILAEALEVTAVLIRCVALLPPFPLVASPSLSLLFLAS